MQDETHSLKFNYLLYSFFFTDLMQSTEDAVSLFSKDQFLSSTNVSLLLIEQKISIDLSLCPSCKKHDFSISADHHTKCYCYQMNGKCAKCTCSNISNSIFVRNFPCKKFHFYAKENRLMSNFTIAFKGTTSSRCPVICISRSSKT